MIWNKIKATGLGMILLSLVIIPSTATAGTGSSTLMATGARTSAPFGHMVFCKKNGNQCRKKGSGVKHFSQKSWRQLVSTNSRVNRSIRPREDGKVDKWQTNVRVGDCEDYALTKRARLLAAGWPSSSLLVTTGYLRNGTYHAVLVARTDRGDFVLDNLSSTVKPWRRVGYRWKKQQSSSNPRQWVKLTGGSKRPVMVASKASKKSFKSASLKRKKAALKSKSKYKKRDYTKRKTRAERRKLLSAKARLQAKARLKMKAKLRAKAKRSNWSLFEKRKPAKTKKRRLITAAIR